MLQPSTFHTESFVNGRHRSRTWSPHFYSATAKLHHRRSRCLKAASSAKAVSYIFEIDSVVDGLQQLTTHWAFTAANTVFQGSPVPGSPDLYQQHMRQLLSVTRHPYEAVLLIRLLADEGIVGTRSVSGREGPVVGRPVRHSGSRPLLIQEILEFWEDEVHHACLLRWSRQLGMTTQQLEEDVKQAYLTAQQSTLWRITDTQQHCHGSSSSNDVDSSSSSSSEVFAVDSTNSRQAAAAATVCVTAASSSTVAVLPAAMHATKQQQQQQQQQQDTSTAVATAVVQPYTAVVQALLCCEQQQSQIVIFSSYPPDVTAAALAAAGLRNPPSRDNQAQAGRKQHCYEVVQADDLASCVHLLHQQQLTCTGSSSSSGSGSSSCAESMTFVVSSPSKAQLIKDNLSANSSSSSLSHHSQQQQQQQQRVSLLVGDWVCSSPSLRAKTLSCRNLDLLSEVGLAGLLGVSNCDTVMDGVAWRE